MCAHDLIRCDWVGDLPLYQDYHDTEWGVPSRDSQHHYEHLFLEGMQAGLSWLTILKRRDAFRKAFAGFHAEKIAAFTDADLERLMQDPSIIRNRPKISAARSNARAYLDFRDRGEDFATFLYSFVGGKPRQNTFETLAEVPAQTPESVEASKALKALGFRFVGPTIVYAHFQATGIVNDHLVTCFRHREVAALAE